MQKAMRQLLTHLEATQIAVDIKEGFEKQTSIGWREFVWENEGSWEWSVRSEYFNISGITSLLHDFSRPYLLLSTIVDKGKLSEFAQSLVEICPDAYILESFMYNSGFVTPV